MKAWAAALFLVGVTGLAEAKDLNIRAFDDAKELYMRLMEKKPDGEFYLYSFLVGMEQGMSGANGKLSSIGRERLYCQQTNLPLGGLVDIYLKSYKALESAHGQGFVSTVPPVLVLMEGLRAEFPCP